jgi:hypothetical protein
MTIHIYKKYTGESAVIFYRVQCNLVCNLEEILYFILSFQSVCSLS